MTSIPNNTLLSQSITTKPNVDFTVITVRMVARMPEHKRGKN